MVSMSQYLNYNLMKLHPPSALLSVARLRWAPLPLPLHLRSDLEVQEVARGQLLLACLLVLVVGEDEAVPLATSASRYSNQAG